jgi:gamma-glutamyltranspeptidase/glutathione hydrolase
MRPLFLIFLCSCSAFYSFTQKSETFKNAAVVCAHPAAALAGKLVLENGGNACDAAVAVHFALAVVYPNAGNIGGGGFFVYRDKKGNTNALDFRETAPGKAHAQMFLDENGNVADHLSLDTHLASGVPGSVAGMVEIHKKYGSLPFKNLLLPALFYAYKGFAVTERQAAEMNELAEEFQIKNPNNSYLRNAGGWKAGDLLVQTDLGKTLERIANLGAKGFYDGETADLIVAEMKRKNGIIDKEDLLSYKPIWRSTISGTYKNFKIISMPPPSSGGVALLQLLKLVETFDLKKSGLLSTETINIMCEAEKLVYADRSFHLGDPDFITVPAQILISEGYLKKRRTMIQAGKALPSEKIKHGNIQMPESEQTTHYSIVDKFGNAASVTTTINDSYGSKIFVTGAGFLLNNEMDDFSIKPGHANLFGLTGSHANAIAPGKRMLSSMTPTIVEKNGDLFLILGSPGGSTIITSVFQNILNICEHGLNAVESNGTARFHHQWLPDKIFIEENAFASNVQKALQKIGYRIEVRKPIGRVEIIQKMPDGSYLCAPDGRGDDSANGF